MKQSFPKKSLTFRRGLFRWDKSLLTIHIFVGNDKLRLSGITKPAVHQKIRTVSSKDIYSLAQVIKNI